MNLDRRIDWCVVTALTAVMVLAFIIRLPALTWPQNQQPLAGCCGHPDEENHYEVFRLFPSSSSKLQHAPGYAFSVYIADHLGLGRVAELLIPADVSDSMMTRGVYTARLVSFASSFFAAWLMYLIGRWSSLAGPSAAMATALFALAPLFQVYSIYGLPDALNAALVLGYVYTFFQWTRLPTHRRLFAFAFLLGTAFAVKLGILIGIPLVLYAFLMSRRRLMTVALLGSGIGAGAILVSGGSFGIGRMQSVFDMVYYENVLAAERSFSWNAIHYAASIVPGMGVHFAILLTASLIGWISWCRTAGLGSKVLLSNPWPAVALGCVLHFIVSLSFGDPFARHMLVLYPFLAIFAVTGISYIAILRTRMATGILLMLSITLSAFAAWPVLGSFANDPNISAARFLREHAGSDDCVLFSQYSARARQLFFDGDKDARCEGEGRSPRFMTVHSNWSGRLTGSWWLKPRPKNASEVYKFSGDRMLDFSDRSRELQFWQGLFDGQDKDWRIVAVFGEEWWSAEQIFLHLVGRGYDQLVTTGKVFVVERLEAS